MNAEIRIVGELLLLLLLPCSLFSAGSLFHFIFCYFKGPIKIHFDLSLTKKLKGKADLK